MTENSNNPLAHLLTNKQIKQNNQLHARKDYHLGEDYCVKINNYYLLGLRQGHSEKGNRLLVLVSGYSADENALFNTVPANPLVPEFVRTIRENDHARTYLAQDRT